VEEAPSSGPLRARFSLAAVLCYEALFPRIVASRRDPEAVALLSLADDAWLGAESASRSLSAFASFRAIEERLAFVRVAHGGMSRAVDPFGELLLELPRETEAHGTVRVRASAPPGVLEKLLLVLLPFATGSGVWCALRSGAGPRPVASSSPTPTQERISP
jgi:apolipoprotein N-acyltransferase